jgi:hypothetical protein
MSENHVSHMQWIDSNDAHHIEAVVDEMRFHDSDAEQDDDNIVEQDDDAEAQREGQAEQLRMEQCDTAPQLAKQLLRQADALLRFSTSPVLLARARVLLLAAASGHSDTATCDPWTTCMPLDITAVIGSHDDGNGSNDDDDNDNTDDDDNDNSVCTSYTQARALLLLALALKHGIGMCVGSVACRG